MSKVDWSKAPDWATGHGRCGGRNFWISEKQYASVTRPDKITRCTGLFKSSSFTNITNRTADREWPEESRIDIIGTNGNTGEAYQSVEVNKMVSAQDFLGEGLKILGERGKQYGSNERECSFPQVAQAFNAITGNNLKGSDICLVLLLVKQVRQYAQPERFHEDSAVDGVNYTALQAQELRMERKNESK